MEKTKRFRGAGLTDSSWKVTAFQWPGAIHEVPHPQCQTATTKNDETTSRIETTNSIPRNSRKALFFVRFLLLRRRRWQWWLHRGYERWGWQGQHFFLTAETFGSIASVRAYGARWNRATPMVAAPRHVRSATFVVVLPRVWSHLSHRPPAGRRSHLGWQEDPREMDRQAMGWFLRVCPRTRTSTRPDPPLDYKIFFLHHHRHQRKS